VAHLAANTKSGVIGVLVRIVPPGTVFPDKKTEAVPLPKVVTAAESVERPQGVPPQHAQHSERPRGFAQRPPRR